MRPDVHTLGGAYALDAVDDLERAEFDRHLAECPACAQEVAELRGTAAGLVDMVATTPPPRMRVAVLSEVRRTPQVGRRHRNPALPASPRQWRVAAAAAVAGLLMIGAGAGTYAAQEQRVRHAQAQTSQADRVAAVLAAADAQSYDTAVNGGGQVRLVVSASMREGVAILSGLPAPGPDHTYQLWLIRGTQVLNVGTVLTSGSGTRLLVDTGGLGGFSVSREPGMKALPKPTGTRVTSIILE